MSDKPAPVRERNVIILNEQDLRKIQVQIRGRDRNGTNNQTLQFSVLAEDVETVKERLMEILRNGK